MDDAERAPLVTALLYLDVGAAVAVQGPDQRPRQADVFIDLADQHRRQAARLQHGQQVMQILNAIIEKNHALRADSEDPSNPGMLNTVLERAVRLAKHDFLICLIAGGGGADENTVRFSTQLAAHNDVIVGFVYDPMEAELPLGGRLVVADGEMQLEVDSGDSRLRTGFSQAFQERLEWMKHITRQRSTPLLPISTEFDVAEQIRDLLQRKQRRE